MIRIKSSTNSINCAIAAVYRHPKNKKKFFEFLKEIILDLNEQKLYYFILGDMNIDVSFKTSNSAIGYLNMLNSNSVLLIAIHQQKQLTVLRQSRTTFLQMKTDFLFYHLKLNFSLRIIFQLRSQFHVTFLALTLY